MSAAVTVLVFGPLRERVGVAELRGAGATVSEVWQNFARDHGLDLAVPGGVRAARNLEYCAWTTPVSSGDVVAFLPPVAGGSGANGRAVRVAMTASPIDIDDATDVGGDHDGAVAVFIGRVRDRSEGHTVSRIEYEAYAEMAEAEMRRIADSLLSRGGVSAIAITHRSGTLRVGEPSVVIAVAAPHRAEALAACSDAIDMVKQTVPIWKREHRDDGARWVDARHGAHAEARR